MGDTHADILFINGNILTQDEGLPQASQIAFSGQLILDLGEDLRACVNSGTQVIDLKGKTVLPGFVDAHLHLLWGGESLLTIPANQATSKESLMYLVSTFAEKFEPGAWLRGGGWNEHLFHDRSYPHKSWLDEAAPGHPMILTRHDGHSGIASSEALKIAGITADTADPPGGVIDKDAEGEPTGILRDAAMGLVLRQLPPETESELISYLDSAQNYLLERGVTAIGDMIHDLVHFTFLQKMAKQGKLKVRISAYLPILKWEQVRSMLEKGIFENDYLQFKGLKAFSDGSLGSHTALMLAPYADTPDSSGIYDSDWSDPQRLLEIMTDADLRGHQCIVHAIGDRAVRETLDMFEMVINKNGPRDRRFRVEHAQHVHPQDQPRFQQLGVIASVQPMHCVDDSRYADKLLEERCSYAYPFASLMKKGATLALGSDWPVSPADPIATIHASYHRAGWRREEAIPVEAALYAHTAGAAYSGFREKDLGSLKQGNWADMIILNQPLSSIQEGAENLDRIIQTVYSNGHIVFSRDA